MPYTSPWESAAYDRQMDRNESARRRALLFRMMRAGATPDRAASWMQLMAAQGVPGYGTRMMSPALYAQMVSPANAPGVYATMAGERLGMEGMRTNRYGAWLGAQSARDLAAMNARRDLMMGGLQNAGAFAASRPPVIPMESPYGAAQQSAGVAYQAGATFAGQEMARREAANRANTAEYLRRIAMQPDESEAIRQQALQGLMYQYGMKPH